MAMYVDLVWSDLITHLSQHHNFYNLTTSSFIILQYTIRHHFFFQFATHKSQVTLCPRPLQIFTNRKAVLSLDLGWLPPPRESGSCRGSSVHFSPTTACPLPSVLASPFPSSLLLSLQLLKIYIVPYPILHLYTSSSSLSSSFYSFSSHLCCFITQSNPF